MVRKWENLPEQMQNEAVKPYYDHLRTKSFQLFLKRLFDIFASLLLIVLFSPVMLAVSIAIVAQSGRPVFFRQKRVTAYGREFGIFKFRTMVRDAEKIGAQITVGDDSRITRIGKTIRKLRLDEIPQLLNVLTGDMSFVGTRPEVPRYVVEYTEEMMATLLLPAGVTSEASIMFKDEDSMLANVANPDDAYVNTVLPKKMKYNLRSLYRANVIGDIRTIARTILAVGGVNVNPLENK